MSSDPDMSPDDAFKAFSRRVGELLRGRGFKGSGQNFRRVAGEQWQVVNLQRSRWRLEADEPVTVYVNIGLRFTGLGAERTAPPPETLAGLTAARSDQAFRLDEVIPDAPGSIEIDGASLDREWPAIASLVRDRLLPALDAMATREGLARVCRGAPWLVTPATSGYLGPGLSPPRWDPEEARAGGWTQDGEDLWWGPGEEPGAR